MAVVAISTGDFNPRSHEGSDPHGFVTVFKLSDFNPRSHEGSDLKSHRKPVIQLYFNPRSHEGSDYPAPFTIATTPDISIHAPTRGATMFCLVMHLSSRFQSTLPRGERQQFSPKSSLFSQQKLSKIFNLNNKLF